MLTGTVWGVTLLIVGFLAALTGGQLLLGTLCSSRLDRSRESLRARPVVSVLVGLVVTTLVGVVAAVLGQVKGVGELAMAVLLLAASLVWIFGLAVVSREVGERMQSPASAPWRALLRGAVTTGLSFALPILGWVVLLPLASAAGVGGVVLSAYRGRLTLQPLWSRTGSGHASAAGAGADQGVVAPALTRTVPDEAEPSPDGAK